MAFLLRWRPSPAMVVALLALFVALGGSSYAAVSHEGGSALAPAGFSVFKDTFRLSTSSSQANQDAVRVARLALPAGSYVVVAKLYVSFPLSFNSETVRCALVTPTDFDRTQVTHDGVDAYSSMSLNVVHRFPSAGFVDLRCGHVGTAGSADLRFVKVTAISVESLSNAPSS
jgi:hypothetical protein